MPGRQTISLDRSVLNRYRPQRQAVAAEARQAISNGAFLVRPPRWCRMKCRHMKHPPGTVEVQAMFGSTPTITRRSLLKWGLAAAGTGLLAACGQQAPAAPPAAAKPTEAPAAPKPTVAQ